MLKFLLIQLFFLPSLTLANPSFFYREALMPNGPFQGQLLNTSALRSFIVLNELPSELDSVKNSQFTYLANIRHNGKNYIGRAPKEGPYKLRFIYEKFIDLPGGHANVVFHFPNNNPLELLFEINEEETEIKFVKLSQPIKLKDIIFTAEAVRIIGDSTPLLEGGLQSKFGMAYRLTSVSERLLGPVLEEGRKTSVIDIPFSAEETSQSFWSSLHKYNLRQMNDNYDLLTRNCITTAIDVVLNGLGQEKRKKYELELKQLGHTLAQRNLKDQNPNFINQHLNEMFQSLVENKFVGKINNILEMDFFLDSLPLEHQKKVSCEASLLPPTKE